MAEGKKSFVLYTEIIHTVRKLSNEKAGELFKHILSYVNDEHPVTDDILIEVAFEPIKQALKKDLQKWQEYQEKQRLNGAKGGRPRKQEETQETQPFQENPTQPKKAVNVNVNVNDNVNERYNITSTDNENYNQIPKGGRNFLNPINVIEKCMLENIYAQEAIAMKNKLPNVEAVQIWIKEFIITQKAEGVIEKSLSDAQSHFSRWLSIQLKNGNNKTATETNPRTVATADKHNSERL